MAQTGYTPLVLYSSTTTGHIPTSGNLQTGELAINVADGVVYYKNTSGNVVPLPTSVFATANYSVTEIAGVLTFKYQGTTIATLNSSGTFTSGV